IEVPQRGSKDSSLLDNSALEQLEMELAGLEESAPVLALKAQALAGAEQWTGLTQKLQDRLLELNKGLLGQDDQLKGLDKQMKTLEQLLEKNLQDWDKRHNML
ncbi:MAG TPA: hypothetical protein VF532_14585, partial [Candidatus Angelobacter sp.]